MSVLAGLFASLAMVADPETTLERLRWEARPILVFAEAEDPRLERQMAMLAEAKPALEDRRNVVVVDTLPASRLRERFEPDGFTVILVGLDGAEKYRAGEVVPPDAFNDMIDAMPMRRRELRREDRPGETDE